MLCAHKDNFVETLRLIGVDGVDDKSASSSTISSDVKNTSINKYLQAIFTCKKKTCDDYKSSSPSKNKKQRQNITNAVAYLPKESAMSQKFHSVVHNK